MLSINTNTNAQFAARALWSQQSHLANSMKRLSSGLRINSASDDASGLAISDRMTSQIRGLNQASRNINDGVSMLQTTEGAMQEVVNLIQRGRELAVQAANDTNSVSDLESLQAEVDQIKAEINRIGNTTSFNGQYILRDASSGGGDSALQDKIDVQDGLRTGWLRNAEQIIIDGYGLTGIGGDMTVIYENDSGNDYVAWVTNSYNPTTREAVNQELHIDLSDFVPVDSADGGTAPYYNDRIIAHEMVHAVMGVTMNSLDLPTWFQEGAAELIQGGDERISGVLQARFNSGESVAVATAGVVNTLSSPWSGPSNPTLLNEQYAAAYTAARFLHDEIKNAGGTGMDELMGLLSANKENNSYALDQALADLQATHSTFAYADESSFLTAFTGATGATYLETMYTSGDLANIDTGAIGGLDADGGEVKTAETVVPNGAGYDESPLVGFNTIWEELSISLAQSESFNFQIGANSGDNMTVTLEGISTNSLDIGDIDISIKPDLAIIKFDRALAQIDQSRGTLGALMNRMESAMANAANAAENLSAARSRIQDADIVSESAALTRGTIMQQAAASILTQATTAPEIALRLLS